MNIAFYTYYECCPSLGGTERTTSLVANSLKNIYKYNVYSIYQKKVDLKKYEFIDEFQFNKSTNSKSELAKFIKDNNISVVINQAGFGFGKLLYNLIKEENLPCKQIFALHSPPGGYEEARIRFQERIKIWKSNKFSVEAIKIILYPLYYAYMHNHARKQYRIIENISDKIVLLSDNFKSSWSIYAHGKIIQECIDKLVVIPNALSFDHFANKDEINNKGKIILIVARLEEIFKKLSKALIIWKNIASNPEFCDWKLDIVGDGSDKEWYKSIIQSQGIPRVTFHGRQDPTPFYEKSSIFIMTSAFEGWGMTLTEASQYGVIPFAFNTSLSLSDIINDGINGFIIPPDDFETYVKRLEHIMKDTSERIRIAMNAVENSKRFSVERISKKWHRLIEDVTFN